MLRRLRFIAVILLFLLGIAGVAIGLLGEHLLRDTPAMVTSMVSVFGAALFGASLSMIIEELLGTEVRDIWHYLTAKERFDSAPDYLDAVVGVWHVYYLTKANGERIWKYVTYALAKGDSGKSITGHFSVLDQHGRPRYYAIEAGVRGDSLIAVFRATSGRENDSIEVVPRMTHTHLDRHVGLQMLETWDGELGISLSLYSRDKLVDDPVGTVRSGSAKLTALLEESMRTQSIIDLIATR